jgi:molybdenum cofactor cytidylyltransferase
VNARYAAIVPAGGLSTRMHQVKPLLPLGEETVADHVIAAFLSAGANVFLVTGYRHDAIKAGINQRDFKIIFNPDYKTGMFSSVKAGVRRLLPEHEAFFINPVDIPLVRPATIRRLMAAAAENPDKIIYPVFGGKRGHPPLVPRSLIPTILDWRAGGGLKAVLASQEKLAMEVPVPDGNILFDVDTPEDYTVLLKRYQRYEVPTDEECDMILKDICQVPPDRIRHNLKVSEAAAAIARALRAASHELDIELVRVAAKVHDIAKGQRKHDIAGGKILRELGFGKVADIVAVHSDLAGGNTSLSLEAKTVYLADKLIEGEKPVSLEKRYSSSMRRFGMTPEIEAGIRQRLEVTKSVKKELEGLLGRNLEAIISDKI